MRDYGTAQWEGGVDGCDHLQVNDTRDPASCKQTSNYGTSQIGFKESCGKCGAKRIDSQLGLEKTPEEYVAKMVEVFREVRRVLRKDGTLWLNLGDSYNQNNRWGGEKQCSEKQMSNTGTRDFMKPANADAVSNSKTQGSTRITSSGAASSCARTAKAKELVGIPWLIAFALSADGWWLRSDIIWAKPNPMPESVTDRPTKAHEYLFLLTKSSNYFYDAEAIKEKSDQIQGARPFGGAGNGKQNLDRKDYFYQGDTGNRNKRSVWAVATAPYADAHFATYPPDLIKPCILAGTSAKGCCAKCGSPWERIIKRQAGFTDGICNGCGQPRNKHVVSGKSVMGGAVFDSPSGSRLEDGSVPCGSNKTIGWQPTCDCKLGHGHMMDACTVLDPFAGSGTTGAVALELGRKAILIELNQKYVELIRQRCNITPGLQLA